MYVCMYHYSIGGLQNIAVHGKTKHSKEKKKLSVAFSHPSEDLWRRLGETSASRFYDDGKGDLNSVLDKDRRF